MMRGIDTGSKVRRWIRVVAAALTMATVSGFGTFSVRGDERAESFAGILDRQTRQTFAAVAEYISRHPAADDTAAAHQWLFEAALLHGLEAEALPLAEAYLKSETADPGLVALGRVVQSLGYARTGRLPEALDAFEAYIRSLRLRVSNSTFDVARSLASQAQLAGNFAAARDVYQRLSGAFFLNNEVKQICESRLAKLDLIGKPAPAIDADDLDGKRVNLGDSGGEVVLVDFWATNCAPCLEEFPKMKQLYADYHEQGFQIVGISLDEHRRFVDEFQERWALSWRLVVQPEATERLREAYRVPTIPATYLIDKEGNVALVDIRGRDLRAAVQKLLEAKK